MFKNHKSCVCVRVCARRSCPGAVLLLPLLELHLSRFCQALDSLRSTSSGGTNSGSASSLPAGRAAAAAGLVRPEETGLTAFSVEDTGLAALRLLYLVLAHSDEVMTQQCLSLLKSHGCSFNRLNKQYKYIIIFFLLVSIYLHTPTHDRTTVWSNTTSMAKQ